MMPTILQYLRKLGVLPGGGLVPPLQGYPRRLLQPSDEVHNHERGLRNELVLLECGWCGKWQYHWSRSEPASMGQRTFTYASSYTGDSICQNCGRGIYLWWTPMVIYREWADGSFDRIYADGSSCRSGKRQGTPKYTWFRDPEGSVESTVFI